MLSGPRVRHMYAVPKCNDAFSIFQAPAFLSLVKAQVKVHVGKYIEPITLCTRV